MKQFYLIIRSLHRRRHYLKCAFKAIDLLTLDLIRQATKGAVA